MLKNLSIKNKLVGVIVYLVISLAIVGFMGMHFMGLSNETTKVMYEEQVTKLTILDATIRLMNKNQDLIAQTIIGKISTFPESDAVTQKHIAEIAETIIVVSKLQDDLLARTWTQDEQATIEQFRTARKKYGAEGVMPAVAALKSADYQQAMEVLQGPLRTNFVALSSVFDELIQSQLTAAKL
ncbi:MAG: Tar ligand binding domain-containing protein, partial [Sulfuriferula sp.]